MPDAEINYDAFREEVRTFIAENYPQAKRELNARQAGLFAEPELGLWWHNILYEKGWIAPHWPKEYGGTGWDALQRHIFAEESAAADAPQVAKFGLALAGPSLMRFGTQEQKDFFLPRILSGEIYFCQGFSEPGSGSDLASLRTRAVRDGDEYIVNGSKTWTTHAHHANWIFFLARTATEGKPQAGISFFLAPMNTPGITIRPIISMSGEHEVNETFLDNVRVPTTMRVGEENQGWTITKYLLEFERSSSLAILSRGLLEEAVEIALKQPGDNSDSFWDDEEFRTRAFEHEIDILALDASERAVVASTQVGSNVGGVLAAALKITGSELYQRSAEFCVEALGDYAFPDQHESLPASSNISPIGPSYAARPSAKYLNNRAYSIFAGSNEVLRNVIAAAGCGLK